MVGFVAGFGGNLISDYVLYHSGPAWVWPFTKDMAIWWQWSVGNGIVGLIPGIYAITGGGQRYRTFSQQVTAFIVALLGIAAGMAFASYSSIPLCQPGGLFADTCFGVPDAKIAFDTFTPAFISNAVAALLLVPITLFNVERLNLNGELLSSALIRRLMFTVLASAALPTLLLGLFLLLGNKESSTLPRLLLTVFISLLFTIANAGLLGQGLSGPLVRLTRAAEKMRQGNLSVDEAKKLSETTGEDEVARLGQLFGQMAQDVIKREQSLKQQVAQLNIEIDLARKEREVKQITENEYFKSLQSKANEMRSRHNNP
jgi:HAMP domain-containing protein